MKRHVLIPLLFAVALVTFLVVITWQPERPGTTQTTVTVQEGEVEVTSRNGEGESRSVGEGESAIAMSGELREGAAEGETASGGASSSLNGNGDGEGAQPTPEPETADAALEAVTKEIFSIAGYVSNEKDEMLAGSTIKTRAWHENKYINLPDVTTDANGYYLVESEYASRHFITSLPPEEYLEMSSNEVLSASEPTKVYNFKHAAAGLSAHGIVLDKNTSEPIVGAEVRLSPNYQQAHKNQQTVEGKSDAEGKFRLARLAEGNFNIEVKADGYITYAPQEDYTSRDPMANIQVNEKTQTNELVVKLEVGGAALVRVTDKNKAPVADAQINIHHNQNYSYYRESYKTDARGEEKLDKLRKLGTVVRVKKESYGEAVSAQFEPGTQDDPVVVEVTLNDPATVSGNVSDKEGNVVKDRRLFANYTTISERLGSGGAGITLNEARTDDQGNYQFNDLGEGSYKISVQSPDQNDGMGSWRDVATKDVTLDAGEQKTGVDFVIEDEEPGKEEIQGKVVNDKSEPVANASVMAQVIGDSIGVRMNYANGMTNENGEFHLKGMSKADTFHFSVNARGYSQFSQQYPMDGAYLTVTLKSNGSISGTVVSKETRQPVQTAQVFVENARNPYGRAIVGMSGEDGTFVIDDVEGGSYTLTAMADGYAKTTGPQVTVETGAETGGVVVEIEKGLEFHGVVMNRNSQPVGGAVIGLLSASNHNSNQRMYGSYQRISFSNTVTSNDDGTFVIDAVSANGDSLVASHDEYASTVFQITPDMFRQTNIPVRLTEGGVVEGAVYDKDDRPQPNVSISVYSTLNSFLGKTPVTDENGYYRAEHLPPGSYNVTKGSNNDVEFRQATIEDGKTVRIDFGGKDGAVIYGIVYKEDQPVANARIEINMGGLPGQQGFRMTANSETDGSYMFKGLPEGSYTIVHSAEHQGYLNPYQSDGLTEVTVTKEQKEYRVDLRSQGYEITGVIVDADTGEPVSQARVQMGYGAQMNASDMSRMIMPTTSNESGAFTLKPRAEGTYKFTAQKDGFDNTDFEVTIDPQNGLEKVSVELTMKKSSTLVTVMLRDNNAPFVGQYSQVMTMQDGNMLPLNSKPDPDQPGSILVTGLQPGVHDLFIASGGQNGQKMGFVEGLQVQAGSPHNVLVELIDLKIYQIHLVASDGSTVNGSVKFNIPDFPILSKIPSMAMVNNGMMMMGVPAGRHLMQIKIDGYRQASFYPEDLPEIATGGQMQVPNMKAVTLNLVKE